MKAPQLWLDEIAKGTAFGKRAELALASAPTRQPRAHKPATPDVSTLGTRIIEAIETAAGYRINCGQCKSYLRSLNKTLTPDDAEAIVGKIIGGIGLPANIRNEVGGTKEQRVWLMAIVSRVMESTGPS